MSTRGEPDTILGAKMPVGNEGNLCLSDVYAVMGANSQQTSRKRRRKGGRQRAREGMRRGEEEG